MKRVLRTSVVVAFVILLFASRSLFALFTDWWWYQEIHNAAFFAKSIAIKFLMFVCVFAIMSIPSLATIFVARKLAPLRIRVLEGNMLEFPEHLIRPYLFPLLYFMAALIALFSALGAVMNWTILLPLLAHVPFGVQDPIFNKDVGFYVFYLPILEMLYQLGMSSFAMALIMAVVSYGIQKVLRLGPHGFQMAPVVSIHLSVLLAFLSLCKAFGYWIERYGLLLQSHGTVYGIGYADFHARLPLLTALTAVAVLTSAILFLNIRLANWKPVIALAVIWGLISVSAFSYSRVVQKLEVVPSELDRERSFLANNIQFTRKAYALEDVKQSRVQPAAVLTRQDQETHRATLENIRLWDSEPLLKTLAQLQEIRPYYTLRNIDVDRYPIQNKIRQVMISARELDYGRLQNPTWAKEHLIFTHGYGFVATPVNEVTSEGLPDFFVKDIPPSGVVELHADDPEIYYGEVEDNYCIVNSKQQEFNYPSGDENKNTHYRGEGGVPLDSLLKRLTYAAHFSFEIFFSSDVDPKSKIMYHRAVSDRLAKAFPLLNYDMDPYLVVDHGRLYWLCDAYTVNDHFPYSVPIGFHGDRYNYIRNSAKAIVDAYNGTVTYYISDANDPIIQMYTKVFPGLFHPFSEMPPGLKAHIRVPEDFFMVQAMIYSLYHMTSPDVFYNREDLWQLPHPSGEEEMHPYYVVMQVPGSDKPEFLLMLPFTPNKKDNLAAWMAARCDEAHYGEKLVFEFPKESLVFGPSQIQARINQDPKFSQLRTLWGQQGSRITLGHLQVIPVGNAIIYVQPLYIKAEHRELPELKLVVLAYGERIILEETLGKAVAALFSGAKQQAEIREAPLPNFPRLPGSVPPARLAEALLHYNRAMQYQKAGDWDNYGKEIRIVGKILESLSNHP